MQQIHQGTDSKERAGIQSAEQILHWQKGVEEAMPSRTPGPTQPPGGGGFPGMDPISRELPIKSKRNKRQVRPGCSSCSVRVQYFNTVIGCSSFFFSLYC